MTGNANSPANPRPPSQPHFTTWFAAVASVLGLVLTIITSASGYPLASLASLVIFLLATCYLAYKYAEAGAKVRVLLTSIGLIALSLFGGQLLPFSLTGVSDRNSPASDGRYRPAFLFGSIRDIKSGGALEPHIHRLSIAENRVSVSFEYNLPQNGKNDFSGFQLDSLDTTDVSEYQYLRVVYVFNDAEAKCKVFINDVKGNLRYVMLDRETTDSDMTVTSDGDAYTILILLSSSKLQGLDPRYITQVGFWVQNDFTNGQHSLVIQDVSFTNE